MSPPQQTLEPPVYLVVYTRKRLMPLIRKIPLFILLVALAVPLALTAAVIYFHFAATGLKRQAAALELNISAAREQLATADSISQVSELYIPAVRNTRADILFDLRPPQRSDSLSAAETNGGGVYAVQISSHRNHQEAVRVVSSLVNRLARPVLIQQTVLANGRWYRVLIEPFESREAAAGYADSLLAAGVIEEFTLHRLPHGWREDPAFGTPATN
jgi:hypothetical protein